MAAAATLRTSALRCADALVFSSTWLALAAAALVAASARSLGLPADPRALGLAFAGTFAVYNIDRLRDRERDRRTAPLRTAFVVRHESALRGGTAIALLLALGFAVSAGVRAAGVLLPALVFGLAHRRLKRFAFFKPAYIVAAWLTVVVGLPLCLASALPPGFRPAHAVWLLAVLALAILPNAIAANVRDGEAGAARLGSERALAIARGLAALGVIVAALAPGSLRALASVPAATLAALVPFRASERYGLSIVDGALLLGALVALLLLGV